jgi:2-(1,2-epoxy-1,2-dihydrophenyl)acetyl-CoA isomerase
MMSGLVLLEIKEAIAALTLNRPERHNSLIPALLKDMLSALAEIEKIPEVRVVILRANGRSFSTGGDMRGFHTHLEDIESYSQHLVGLLNEVILALLNFPQPVVVAVQGIVTGGSMGLVLASDIVLVAPEATFTPYYSVVGFTPDGGWTAMLPAVVGIKRTAEILMTNQTITAQQAVAWGLASRIVPGQNIGEEALKLAAGLVSKKAGSLRHTKRLLDGGYDEVAVRLERERAHFVRQITTPEARQGILDFLRRDAPRETD